MKKTNLAGIPVLTLIIAGVFLFISPDRIVAQSEATFASGGGPYVAVNDQFVAPDVAISILQTQLINLNQVMESNPAHSEAHKQAVLKYIYYEKIIDLLIERKASVSKDVGGAIANGLIVYHGNTKYGVMSPAQILQNKQTAINLLRL